MYKLSRYTSYLEKNNIYAVYCNFNLYFFKNDTYNWFKSIINEEKKPIDYEFINFLLSKEIIYKCGDDNV